MSKCGVVMEARRSFLIALIFLLEIGRESEDKGGSSKGLRQEEKVCNSCLGLR